MSEKKKKELQEWHAEQLRCGKPYDFAKEMEDYCKSDMALLQADCKAFTQEFERHADFNPFAKCVTIASAWNLYWRKHCLKEDTIAVEPLKGWRGANVNNNLAPANVSPGTSSAKWQQVDLSPLCSPCQARTSQSHAVAERQLLPHPWGTDAPWNLLHPRLKRQWKKATEWYKYMKCGIFPLISSRKVSLGTMSTRGWNWNRRQLVCHVGAIPKPKNNSTLPSTKKKKVLTWTMEAFRKIQGERPQPNWCSTPGENSENGKTSQEPWPSHPLHSCFHSCFTRTPVCLLFEFVQIMFWKLFTPNTCIRSSGLPVGSHGIVGRRAQKSGHQLAASPYWITRAGIQKIQFDWDKWASNPCLVAISACLKLFRLIYYPLYSQSNRNETHLQKLQWQGQKR